MGPKKLWHAGFSCPREKPSKLAAVPDAEQANDKPLALTVEAVRVTDRGVRLVRSDFFRNRAMELGPEDAGGVVIDHYQPTGFLPVRHGQGLPGSIEEVADLHELIGLGNIFRAGRRQNQRLPVACHLEVAIGFLDDLAKLAQESVNIVPTQIVGDRMLEDCLVGAQVRTSEFRGRCHRIGYECEHPKRNAFA